MTLSLLNGEVIRAVNRVSGSARSYLTHKLRLKVGDADHPMVDNLNALGLDGAKPDQLMVSLNYQSSLGQGTKV